MVAQAGASSEAPVSIRAGYANLLGLPPVKLAFPVVALPAIEWRLPHGYYPHPKSAIYLDYRRCSPRYTDNYRKIHHIAAPSEREARRSLVRDHVCFSLVASVWRWLMRNYFRITGYAVNKRGLTVGIGYQLISSDTKTATAHAVLQAQREGLSHVRITRVQEVSA